MRGSDTLTLLRPCYVVDGSSCPIPAAEQPAGEQIRLVRRTGASRLPWQGHEERRAQSTGCLFPWSGGQAGVGAEPGSSLPSTGMAAPLLRRRRTSWADIPLPGTEPGALFPPGAQPSPAYGFVQRLCPGPRAPLFLLTTQPSVSQRPWKNAHVDGIFLANSSQHPNRGRTASCGVPACPSHGSVGHKLVRALWKPQP